MSRSQYPCLALYISMLFSLTSIRVCIAAPKCDASDRKYNCNCVSESNDTDIVDDKYNITSHFIPAIKSLHYCQGTFQCIPTDLTTQPTDAINTSSYLVCFSDESCLWNSGSDRVSVFRAYKDACGAKDSCSFLGDLAEFNITNASLEIGAYKCIKFGPEKLKFPYCIKAVCKSFTAVEKLCVCNYNIRNCRCSSYCQNLLTTTSHKTYGLFLSFGDVYTLKSAKESYLSWVILFVLCIGLIILLIIFCSLCKAAVDPSCGNEAQNPDLLRRILASNLESVPAPLPPTTAKSSFSAVERCSPPPTYEQVLKDKCIEFKKSVA